VSDSIRLDAIVSGHLHEVHGDPHWLAADGAAAHQNEAGLAVAPGRLEVSRIHGGVGRLQRSDVLVERADDDIVAILLQDGMEPECALAPEVALVRQASEFLVWQPGQALGQIRIGDDLRRCRLLARLGQVDVQYTRFLIAAGRDSRRGCPSLQAADQP
jgi:hypothetical protein